MSGLSCPSSPRFLRFLALTTCITLCVCAAGLAQASTHLARAEPADHQVDAAALDAAFAAADDLGHMLGMVVVRDGHVLGERYWYGGAESLRQSRSTTKSVVSLLVGIAMEHGYISSVQDRMVDYLPPELIPDDPLKQDIMIFHLLTMTSGFQWIEDDEVGGWLSGVDPVGAALARPMAGPPGTIFNYDTASSHLLSVVLSRATGMSTLEFADTYLFGPLGITERQWLVTGGYENGGHGLHVSTEDLAKVGVMTIDGGLWEGQRIVSKYWVNRSTYPAVRNIGNWGPLTDRHYGYLWWLANGPDVHTYSAIGWGGQFIFCVPALRLVVATHSLSGVSAATARQQETAILEIIVNHVMAATTDRRVFTAAGQEVPELAAVDSMMEGLLREHEIRDATVALTKDGRLVHARGYTLGEPEVQAVQPTALFRSGSIAKAITSVAMHQLIEQELIGYDTPVVPTVGLEPLSGETADPWLDEVTVDHMLCHTGGLYSEDNIYEVSDLVAEAIGEGPPCTEEEITSFIAGKPFRFAPGTNWDYNNYGYMMLGLLLEHSTGKDFVSYVQDHIFNPVGVSRPRLGHMLECDRAPTEVTYDGLEGDPYRSPVEGATAAGAWVLAAPDLARVFSALFDDPQAGGLLAPETREEMLELPFPVSEAMGYGRGWMHEAIFGDMGHPVGWLVDLDDGLDLYAHGGGGTGVHTLALWRSDNIVFVMLTNKDPVAEELDFPEITTWPDHDLWDQVGVSLGPVPPTTTEAWIPLVARADGAEGSRWRSDVGLLNRSSLANLVRLRLYQEDGSHDLELSLEPAEYRTVGDVLNELGVEGSGPLRVFASEGLTVGSRTFSQGDEGTSGQFLEAVDLGAGLHTGDSVVIMQLEENDRARSNIGVLNGWKRPAEVTVDLYDGSGELLASVAQTIAAEQTVQLNRPFFNHADRSDLSSAYAVVTVGFGEQVAVYGSVVDNGSNDPTTMPMKGFSGATSLWVAAAAHAAGENDSLWRTDLAILNLSGAPAAVQLRYRGDDGSEATQAMVVASGAQELMHDVVGILGAEGAGAIEVVSDLPVMVSSRTYNQNDLGTLGQFLDGCDETHFVNLNEIRWLPQLVQNEFFRTNIGVLNTGSGESRLRIRLYDSAGVELAVIPRTLAAGERLQLQEPFSRIADRDDIDGAYATVEVREGGGVLCYGSVVDNQSNDPTTIPAQE